MDGNAQSWFVQTHKVLVLQAHTMYMNMCACTHTHTQTQTHTHTHTYTHTHIHTQGATLVLENGQTLYKFKDKGILVLVSSLSFFFDNRPILYQLQS